MKALKKIWMDGKFVDWDSAKIHVLTHGLHYGYTIFEGIRCFSTKNGPAIFRLQEHMDRLVNSAKIYQMSLPFDKKELSEACAELVRQNGVDECYIRPIAFSAYGEMGINPVGSKISMAIACWERGPYLGEQGSEKGVRCMVSSWSRIDSRSLPPQAKCAANYANSLLATMEATNAGYDEAIMLNSIGMVAEGPGENIFRVKDGVLSTPPANSGIIRGITRDTVLQFARDMGVAFHRNDFTREELFTSDELFFSGTAAGVVSIREISGRPIGDGSYHLVKKIQRLYSDATHGRAKRYVKWLTPVNQ